MRFVCPSIHVFDQMPDSGIDKGVLGDALVHIAFTVFLRAVFAVQGDLGDRVPGQKVESTFAVVHVPERPGRKLRSLAAVLDFNQFFRLLSLFFLIKTAPLYHLPDEKMKMEEKHPKGRGRPAKDGTDPRL
jgi:hypothetical protein